MVYACGVHPLVCEHVRVSDKLLHQSHVSSINSHLIFLRQGLLLNLEFTILARPAGHEPLGSFGSPSRPILALHWG